MQDIGWIWSGIFRFDVTLFARFLWIMEIDALILFMTTSLGNLSLELQRFILQFVAIWGRYSHSFLLIFFMLKVQLKMPNKELWRLHKCEAGNKNWQLFLISSDI